MLRKSLLALAALATVGAAAAPTAASAWPWQPGPYRWGGHPWGYRPWCGWRYGYWGPGWGPRPGVFAAGVLGVAIGASLANPYYGPPPTYYAGPGYWGYYGGCRGYWRWAPAQGRYVRAAACY